MWREHLQTKPVTCTVDVIIEVCLLYCVLTATALTCEIEDCLNADKRDLRKLLHSLK